MGARLAAALRSLASPFALAILFLLAGAGLGVVGVYELAGRGWAFLAAGMMLSILGIVLVRGLIRGGQ